MSKCDQNFSLAVVTIILFFLVVYCAFSLYASVQVIRSVKYVKTFLLITHITDVDKNSFCFVEKFTNVQTLLDTRRAWNHHGFLNNSSLHMVVRLQSDLRHHRQRLFLHMHLFNVGNVQGWSDARPQQAIPARIGVWQSLSFWFIRKPFDDFSCSTLTFNDNFYKYQSINF